MFFYRVVCCVERI